MRCCRCCCRRHLHVSGFCPFVSCRTRHGQYLFGGGQGMPTLHCPQSRSSEDRCDAAWRENERRGRQDTLQDLRSACVYVQEGSRHESAEFRVPRPISQKGHSAKASCRRHAFERYRSICFLRQSLSASTERLPFTMLSPYCCFSTSNSRASLCWYLMKESYMFFEMPMSAPDS